MADIHEYLAMLSVNITEDVKSKEKILDLF